MRNVVLARIDERLIHGQVCTSWLKMTEANVIAIVDDAVAKDMFQLRILKAAAPKGAKLKVFNTKDGAEWLKEDSDNKEKVFVITKVPNVYLDLVNEGVDIKAVQLGNMGMKEGRKKFNKNVSASEEEVAAFKELVDKGVDVYQQMTHTDSKVPVTKVI